MDQLKEFLKQAIKYRFWIAVGLSALLPVIAYFAGAGEIQAKAKTQRDAIEGADKGVAPYMSGTPVNADYPKVVAGKTAELTTEVEQSWKKLYDRQAPLLTWPERVQERFTTWGRQWPKDVDSSAVRIAIIDYVGAYQGFVTEVYKSFKPFDYETGTGVVAAPPEEMLLRPAKFSEQEPPALGKVWAAQERLWIQRTLLDVVATVNKDATNWDTAIIKEIRRLDAGSKDEIARDQRSLAHGEALDLAPPIDDPAKPPEPKPDANAAPGSAGPGAGSGPQSTSEDVYYIHTEPKSPYQVLPVAMTVLIDQDHIQDLLIALENSPMTIQVGDFELSKSLTRVEKPKQGAPGMNFGMNPMFGMSSSATSMVPYGGPMMTEMMMPAASATGYSMDGMGGPATPARKGKDVRSKDLAKARKEAMEKFLSRKGTSIHDPYYNIVEVKVYGQARFFNPPPAPEPSQAAASAAPAPASTEAGAAATTAAPAPADAEKKPEAEKKADEPKAEAEKKADEPKPEAEKKADQPKAEAEKKADEPKPEAEKKAEEPKAEAEKKADEPKPEAEKKADEPKPEGAAPAPK